MTDDKLTVAPSPIRPHAHTPIRRYASLICSLSFVILFAGCATRPTFRTVVVDPGHGGHDPGATQRGVLAEKIWTLDLAYRLKSRLERAGFTVVMTRTNNVFIPLENRVLISNSEHNVIFVSLRSTRGLSLIAAEHRCR